MPATVKLIKDERIPLCTGGTSELIYLGEALRHSSSRCISVRCTCGTHFECSLRDVRQGKTTRCWGCRSEAISKRCIKDLTGQSFGRLRILYRDGHQGKRITYTCVCICGTVMLGVVGNSIKSGNTCSCGCYQKERVTETLGSNWKSDDIIGHFKIIQRVENTKHKKQKYKVLNIQTGRTSCMTAGQIKSSSTALGYFTILLRQRISKALHNKKIRKTKSVLKGLPWTPQYILSCIGPKPIGDFHLDHICPISLGKTEEEVLLLNNPINLRWIHQNENQRKHAKWTEEGARIHRQLLGREWKYVERLDERMDRIESVCDRRHEVK